MEKPTIIVIVLTFLLLLTSVNATNSNSTCIDISNSQTNSTIDTYVNDSLTGTVLTSETIFCPFNCNNMTGKCGEFNGESPIAIVFGLYLASFLFFFLCTNSREEHQILQLLFLIIGFLFLMSAVNITQRIAVVSGADKITTNILDMSILMINVTFFIVIAYFIILLIYNAISSMFPNKKFRRLW